jgi:hypothetical protein
MSAGTLTVHQLLNVLTDLDALALQVATDTSTIYVDDSDSPAVRIVFQHGSAAPGFAASFVIEGPDGSPLYAAGDYAVSLTDFGLAAAIGVEQALAVLLVDLGTLALADGADASLISLKDGLVIEGNDENTLFEIAHLVTLNAGGGDDVIVQRTTEDGGYLGGGEGNDTLWLDTSLGPVTVSLADHSVAADVAIDTTYFRWFDSIEYFRGSIGFEHFAGVGEGSRFEGGDGSDQFLLWNDSPTLVDVVTYADEGGYGGGGEGIVVNLGFDPYGTLEMDEVLEAAWTAALASGEVPANGLVRDTFGNLDNMTTGFLVEGSRWDDFFYGSGVEDGFVGGSGVVHLFVVDG